MKWTLDIEWSLVMGLFGIIPSVQISLGRIKSQWTNVSMAGHVCIFYNYVFSVIYGLSPSGSLESKMNCQIIIAELLTDDWMLNPWLDTIWGPHTIDRFANAGNVQLHSRFWFLAQRL